MKTGEATVFLRSFRNERAREFVRKMMLDHYTEAVLDHHPEPLTREDISGKCQNLIDEIFARFNKIKNRPDKVNELFYTLSRKNPNRDPIWFEEFNIAYEHYKHHKKMFIQMEKIRPFLKGNSYCDVGCGGGDLVHFMKNQYAQFKEYAGIDVMDWRTEEIKDSINFQMLDFSQPGTRSQKHYDTLTCIAVLHHVGNSDETVGLFLRNLKSAISAQGRLIVEEDVILPLSEIQSDHYFEAQVKEKIQDQPLFSELIQLARADQRDAFIMIDLFANSLTGGIRDMAYPFGFKTINQWGALFKEAGYEIEDIRIIGFQKGLFNRSSHVYFVMKPAF